MVLILYKRHKSHDSKAPSLPVGHSIVNEAVLGSASI